MGFCAWDLIMGLCMLDAGGAWTQFLPCNLFYDLLTLFQIKSVALDWKPLRNITECSCSASFDSFSKKVCNLFL